MNEMQKSTSLFKIKALIFIFNISDYWLGVDSWLIPNTLIGFGNRQTWLWHRFK